MTKHYLELILYKALAELRAECGKSMGGAIWWVLDPLLSILVYYAAFGVILNRGDAHFIAFLCVGIIYWRWFQSSLTRGCGSILAESSLIGKVYMPKYIFPAATLLADLLKFSFTLLLLVIFLIFMGHAPGTYYAVLPAVLLAQLMFTAGLVGISAALTPFFPDLRNIIQHGLHLLFFVSGIFFSADQLPSNLKFVVMLNPMAGLIEAYRAVMIENTAPDLRYLAAVCMAGLTGIGIALAMLKKYDKIYPKIC